MSEIVERSPSESMKALPLESVPFYFQEILRMNSNSMCIDCGSTDCSWVSLGFGTVLCLSCAGHHRSMGTHITLVRSITLDSWTEGQLNTVKDGGNFAFQEYVSKLDTSDDEDVNHATEKYNIPEVLYYTEILAAKLAHREPEEYKPNQWIALTKKGAINSTLVMKNHPTWIPDSNAKCCMICFKEFTIVARRHHCRRCGRLTCHHCAPKNNCRPIIEWGLKSPVRHCKECYKSPSVSWKET